MQNHSIPWNWIRLAHSNVGHHCNLMIQRHKNVSPFVYFPQGSGLKESVELYITRPHWELTAGEKRRGHWTLSLLLILPHTLQQIMSMSVASKRGKVGTVRNGVLVAFALFIFRISFCFTAQKKNKHKKQDSRLLPTAALVLVSIQVKVMLKVHALFF